MDNDLGSAASIASQDLEQDIAAYIGGDDPAGGRICQRLEPAIRREVHRFLSASDAECDDVVQETMLSLLVYLRRAGRAPERPLAFVATMAGNRCRNLYRWRRRRPAVDMDEAREWLLGEGGDPLDALEAGEREGLIRSGLARLGARCRTLLLAIYADGRPMEELQREAGLSTVQGIYYRKYSCLKKLGQLLNPRLFGGRESGAKGIARERVADRGDRHE